MAPGSPPEIDCSPEHCPEAVKEWFECSEAKGERYKAAQRRGVQVKAKRHLLSLGWKLWYIDKKTRWELRYTHPITGKTYISLRTACESYINDGGCNIINVPSSFHQPFVEETEETPLSSIEPVPEPPLSPVKEEEEEEEEEEEKLKVRLKLPRKFQKPKGKGNQRIFKKRKAQFSDNDDDDDDDEEYTPVGKVSVARPRRHAGEPSPSSVPSSSSSSVSKKNSRQKTVLPLLIDNNVVTLHARVHCRGSNNVVKNGRLLRSGVSCDCCGETFTLSRFEAHAGCTKHRPAASILLEDGRSLLDCQKQAESSAAAAAAGNGFREDQNDIICSSCLREGVLVLCDRCPSAFHAGCLGLTAIPEGDWFCPQCCCKICNDPRCRDDSDDHVDNTVMACDQCEIKYHFGCLRSISFTKLKTHPNDIWFCHGSCENIYFTLQTMVGKPIPVGAEHHNGLTWTLWKSMKSRSNVECSCLNHSLVALWSQIESKLNVALRVMHECFEPITNVVSGRDMVADVIFSRGSRLNRLNFRGFYTVILEKDEEVVSVASIRVFGRKVAEVSLVATRIQFRRLGMCRVLMDELEKQLIRLGVERIVLPAAKDLIQTWTNSFGFEKMTDSDKSQYLDYNFLEFEDSTLCHKSLKEHA